MNITEKQLEMIEDIMENFNFKKVANTMKHLNWQWGVGDPLTSDEMAVPDIRTIKKRARRLLLDAIDESVNKYDGIGCTVSTGGFEAYYNHNDPYMSLKFVLTEWFTDNEGED